MLRNVCTAGATLATGPALDHFGWAPLNAAMLPVVLLAAAMTFVWARSMRRATAAV